MRNRCPEKLPLLLLLFFVALAGGTAGQTPATTAPDPVPGQTHATKSDHGQGRGSPSQSAVDAVRVFYARIIRYQPVGIPYGRAKKALWPLLSKRLAQELDSLQACGGDYYRRYGEILRKNQYKPSIPWMEDGLFSGPNEAATPMRFSILSSKAVGENRTDVHLGFTYKQTYCCGYPASYDHYEGVVTVILENNRWVVDDFVALDVTPQMRLSDGYAECKGGEWVGRPEESH